MEENAKATETEVETDAASQEETEISEQDLSGEQEGNEEERVEVDEATEEPKTGEKSREKGNAYYARLRREKKALQEEVEQLRREKSEAAFKARAERVSTDALTDLGIDKVETEEQLFLTEAYEEAVKKGSLNPTAEAYKKLSEKRFEDHKKLQEENDNKAKDIQLMNEDSANFEKRYGKPVQTATQDPMFVKMFGKDIKVGEVTEKYQEYLDIKQSIINEYKSANQLEEDSKKMGSYPMGGTSNKATTDEDPMNLTGEAWLKYFYGRN